MKIKLYDNCDNNKMTTVIAHERNGARPWISKAQLKAAEMRAMMIDGSYLRADGDTLGGYDGVDVYDGDNLCGEIIA